MIADAQPAVLARAASPEFDELLALGFSRYPRWEWATFARFGWRLTPAGLVLTLAHLDPPFAGDLEERVGHVALQEPYTLRTALAAEEHALAVGIIHSHPKEFLTLPSEIDDQMDRYYATYFADFAPNRPYISLILGHRDGSLCASGRVHREGRWYPVGRFAVPRRVINVDRLHTLG